MFREYHQPQRSILEQHQSSTISQLFNGEDLAVYLSQLTPVSFVDALTSPQFTSYHLDLVNPFQLAKIQRNIKGLSAILHRDVVMVPSDHAHFALQIPNDKTCPVYFSNVVERLTYRSGSISAILGVEESERLLTFDLTKMPHVLVAGTTGSGKSVLINSIIGSICWAHNPNDCQFVMIDPKQVELSRWDKLNRFLYAPVVTDMEEAAATLEALCDEMDNRYKVMKRKRVTESSGLFSKIIVVIDELADLMLTNRKRVETSIVRIAQLGRAAGIHLILATQRPTANVVTGLIKSNVPCRIALKVASSRDSMVILDHTGAEKLIGNGDALVKFPDSVKTYRFQAPYISSNDVAAISSWWRKQPSWF